MTGAGHSMTLQKLARELDETARQTAAMVDGITDALQVLADRNLNSEQRTKQAIRNLRRALTRLS